MTNDEPQPDDRSIAVQRAAENRIRQLALQRIDEVDQEIGTLPIDEALFGDREADSDSTERAQVNPPGD